MASVPSPSQEDSSHENLSGQPQQPNERSSSSLSSSDQCVPEVPENGNSLTGETNQSQDDTTLTQTIQAQRVPILPQTVRDATQPNGQIDADEAYNRFFEEYYPSYEKRVYRVPPVHIGRLNSKKTKSKQTESLQNLSGVPFQVYSKSECHTLGDTAEARVSDSIENLLNHWIPEKHPAFIITSFKFENFCNQTGNPPQSDENKYTLNYTSENDAVAAVAAERIIPGEHDIIIVDYKVGMIVIQVKACKSHTDPNASVKEAIKQLDKDRDFIKANFEDLNTGVSFTAIVALPFFSLAELIEKTHACKRIHVHNNCDTKCQQECLQRCLLDDNLPSESSERETDNAAVPGCRKTKLCEWWNHITKGCKGFKSLDDYKRVIARYVGLKSTVQIRNLSESVGDIGNRCMNIVLTLQQILILQTTMKKLVIHGEYGSGKTVLLILKARILLRQSNNVCIISMGHSPLIPVLEELIKYDMDPTLFQGHGQLKFHEYVNQSKLKDILSDSMKEKRHVLIDEFPSYVDMDEDIKNAIKDYPSDLSFWCIMSRETEACLTKGLRDSFLSFEKVFMGKVLRCPPSVIKDLPTLSRNDKIILKYPKNKEIKSTINNQKMAEHFWTLGLQTNKEVFNVSPQQWLSWSDIVVIVDNNHKHKEHCFEFLDKLGIPLTTLTNANDFVTKDAVLFVSEAESPGFVRKEVIYLEPDKIVANPKMCEFQGGPKARHIDHTGHAEAEELQQCQKCETELKSMFIELGLKPPQPKEQIVTHPTLEPSTKSKFTHVQAGASEMSQNLLAQAKNPAQTLTYSDMVILDDRLDPQCPAELFLKCQVPVVDKLGVDRLCDEEAFSSNTQVLYIKPHLFQGLERKIVVIITSQDPPDRCPMKDNAIVDYIQLAVTRCSSQLIVVNT